MIITEKIKEPLHGKIKRVANKKVYMVNNEVMSINNFIKKFYKKSNYTGIKSSKLGFSMTVTYPEKNTYVPLQQKENKQWHR